jgi:hypothetical protein
VFAIPTLLSDPNVAMVPVPDPRFKVLCQKYAPKSEVPPVVTVTDIAGLVKVLQQLHNTLTQSLVYLLLESCDAASEAPPIVNLLLTRFWC